MEEFLIKIAPQFVIVITVLFLFLYAGKYKDPTD